MMSQWKNKLFMHEKSLTGFSLVFFCMLLLLSISSSIAEAAGGRISGYISDAESGEPLIGVTVMVEGTKLGAKSDLDGRFIINNVPAGTYTLAISSIGYTATRVENLVVEAKGAQDITVALKQEVLSTDRVVTVTAKAVSGTDAELLLDRQKAVVVSDAISAKTIARSGSADAGEAVKRVTGASIEGGKYVFVRGLSGRYTNTLLNGSLLPTNDQDKHSVHMDIVPAKLLDKVVIKKTFTPDQNGNFTGGSVDIGTKSMPNELTVSLSQSSGYNSQVTFKDNYLSYPGGDLDWLGFDDGTRELPSAFNDTSLVIPTHSQSRRDAENAQLLNTYSREFNNIMAPSNSTAPINQGYAFSFGNQYRLADRPLGVLASLSYNNKYHFYNDGLRLGYDVPTSSTTGLDTVYNFKDVKGVEEVVWGGLAGLQYNIHDHHNLKFNFIYNRTGESTARYLYGEHFYEFAGQLFETRTLKYSERELYSYQVEGEHFFSSEEGLPFRLNWQATRSSNSETQPDYRMFSTVYDYATDQYLSMQSSGLNVPVRYFRNMDETNTEFKFDLSHPLSKSGSSGKLKMGGAITHTKREQHERRFVYPKQTRIDYTGDPAEFFGAETGLIGVDTNLTTGRVTYLFGNVIAEDKATGRINSYDGDQNIIATYGMMELPLTSRLQAVGGARMEITEMSVKSLATGQSGYYGSLTALDWLPSFSLIYKLTDNMNVRSAVSRTLARPIFREKALFRTYEFDYDYKFQGNPDLRRTRITNLDLRWEYFARAGEIFAISGYYKYLKDPITRVIIDTNGRLEPRNVDNGHIYGLELEFRTRLDRVMSSLNNFTLGGNFSWIYSKIRIGEEELQLMRSINPDASDTRNMQGQSPYLINVDLVYDNVGSGTIATLLYNVFGERMSEVSLGGTPDVYEQPFNSLDFTLSQKIIGRLQFSVSASNLLDETAKRTQTFEGVEYITSEYRPGRSISVGTSYSL